MKLAFVEYAHGQHESIKLMFLNYTVTISRLKGGMSDLFISYLSAIC